jgi:hypothetical protein
MSSPYAEELFGDLFGDSAEDFLQNNPTLSRYVSLGLNNAMSNLTDREGPKVGYQGKIPDYTATRRQMDYSAADQESDRRPGSGGRKYFTDTFYGKRGEDVNAPRVLGNVAEAQKAADDQYNTIMGIAPLAEGENAVVDAVQGGDAQQEEPVAQMAAGGLASMTKGYYLGGKTDGMADEVPANIDGVQEARLSDGEFVIPADVVSHLGNGNSDAGAQQLHGMMDNVRQARTGTTQQGKQIDPNKFMPKMAQGGLASFNYGGPVQKFNQGSQGTVSLENNPADSGTADGTMAVGTQTGSESSLSTWAGDYVTDMLGKGKAAAELPYEAYTGPLTAGESDLQSTAFTGLGSIADPTTGMGTTGFTPQAFTTENLQPYMNPFTDTVIDRTAADMQRQSQIDALQDRAAMTSAGAFGGSRDALMRAERAGNLSRNIGDMAAEQRAAGFDRATDQFGLAQDRASQEQERKNQYGLDVLREQQMAGEVQRGITSEGIAADKEQFEEARDFPYQQVQYMQTLLQGLPLAAQQYTYTEPSAFDRFVQGNVAAKDLTDIAAES